MHHPLINFLEQFQPIPLDDQPLIVDAFHHRQFSDGDALTVSGKICNELFYIVSGIARIRRHNDEGIGVTHVFIADARYSFMPRFRER